MKKYISGLLALTLLFSISMARADRISAVDVISHANGFDTLQFALETAGLVPLLDGEERYTIFAPTDEAFQDLADLLTEGDVLALATALVNADLLDDVLAYHVVEHRRGERNLLLQGGYTTLTGQEVTTGVNNQGLFVKGINNETPSSIVTRAIYTRNAVIYPIDQVLINIDPANL